MPVKTIEVTIDWPEEDGGDKVFVVREAGLSFKLEMQEALGVYAGAIDDPQFLAEMLKRIIYTLTRMSVKPKITTDEKMRNRSGYQYIHDLNTTEQFELYHVVMGAVSLGEVVGREVAETFPEEQSVETPHH